MYLRPFWWPVDCLNVSQRTRFQEQIWRFQILFFPAVFSSSSKSEKERKVYFFSDWKKIWCLSSRSHCCSTANRFPPFFCDEGTHLRPCGTHHIFSDGSYSSFISKWLSKRFWSCPRVRRSSRDIPRRPVFLWNPLSEVILPCHRLSPGLRPQIFHLFITDTLFFDPF